MNKLKRKLIDNIYRISFPTRNRLAILKMDRIGDYILFRNFIKSLRESSIYSTFEFVLIGNKDWANLAVNLDASYIDHFVWIDTKKFENNRFYRIWTSIKLKILGINILVHPSRSRDFYIADFLVMVCGAKCSIGNEGDLWNITKEQKSISDGYYHRLLKTTKEPVFEFFEYFNFFKKLLPDVVLPQIPFIPVIKRKIIKSEYLVFFPGASAALRQWPIENFKMVIEYVLQNSDLAIILAGSSVERLQTQYLADHFESTGRVLNLAGKTTLYELTQLIGNSKGLLSNDTSAMHIGAATKIPTVAISKGDFFWRFIPYPKEMELPFQAVIPVKFEKELITEGENRNTSRNITMHNISEVKVSQVIKALERSFPPISQKGINKGFVG